MSRNAESLIAPYLTSLQNRVKGDGICIGSYPSLNKGVYVSLIGQDEQRIRQLGEEVAVEINGRIISEQEGEDLKRSKTPPLHE
jgi:hypothetical protein